MLDAVTARSGGASYPGLWHEARVSGRTLAAGVAAAATVLYTLTAAPGVVWGDSAKLILSSMDFEMVAKPGGHPGYVLLSGAILRMIPLEPARTLNLLSALCGGLAVGVLFRLGERSGGRLSGLIAAGALMVSHLFWYASVIAESYALASLLFLAAFYRAYCFSLESRPRDLVVTSFLLGLAVSANPVAAIMALGLLPLLAAGRKTVRWTWVGLAGAGLLAGLSPYLVAATAGEGLSGLAGDFGLELSQYFTLGGPMLQGLLRYPAHLIYQFPGPGLFLIPLGLVALRRTDPRLAWALVLAWVANVGFAATWLPQRQFMILGVGLFAPAAFAGAGAESAWAWLAARRPRLSRRWFEAGLLALVLVGPVVTYASAPPLAAWAGVNLTGARTVPNRPDSYFLRPWKGGYQGAERFAREAFEEARPGDGIAADFTIYRVLEYQRRLQTLEGVEFLEVDQFIFDKDPEGLAEWVRTVLGRGGRAFFADDEADYYFTAHLAKEFRLEPRGPLWEILPRSPGSH